MMYMICAEFGDYDIHKFMRQPGWWIKSIWKHMIAKGQGESGRAAGAVEGADSVEMPR